jgi:hypothetical protein
MMKDCLFVLALLLSPLITNGDDALDFHDDYYLGFSQGAYYGLMLAGEDYYVAWCMKAELDYAARKLGTGGEFQQNIERLLEECRRSTGQE